MGGFSSGNSSGEAMLIGQDLKEASPVEQSSRIAGHQQPSEVGGLSSRSVSETVLAALGQDLKRATLVEQRSPRPGKSNLKKAPPPILVESTVEQKSSSSGKSSN